MVKRSLFTLIYLLRGMQRLGWSRKKLSEYQNERVREIVRHAFETVPFYNRVLRARGIFPNEIKTVNDLNKIPILTKSVLKQISVGDLISQKYKNRPLSRITTGGSTGVPFSIYIDPLEDAWRKSIYLRANIACGQKPTDRWAAILDRQYLAGIGWIQNYTRFFSRTIVPVTWDRQLWFSTIKRINPEILDGFPNALLLLAKASEQKNDYSIRPRMIFGSGEVIDKPSIKYLERVFAAPYFDQFGCSEIDRSAWQCRQHEGYHMDVDSVIMQFVDDQNDEVGPGEKGEIVYTSLFNYAFPLLRYNIEDIGVTVDEPCPCGKTLPLMKNIEGRRNSLLLFPDGTIVSPIKFIELLGACWFVREIDQYRVIQEKSNLIRIYIKKSGEDVDQEKIAATLNRNLLTSFPKVYNRDVQFEIEFVDEIVHTSRGKHSVVSSKII